MAPARVRRIFGLALPIIGGMVSQNILNLVDTAMVGTLGDAALAAVGIGGFATFTAMSLVLGVSTGVQAMASRRKGEGRLRETAHALNGGLLLVLLVAPVLSAVLWFVVPVIYPWLNPDPDVIRQGTPYLQVRMLAITVVGINFAFRGYWNAVDLSKLYMGTLVVMHATNIFLNYVLIFGKFGMPALGVAGAGIGTALSTVVGAVIYLWLGFRHAWSAGFLQGLPRGGGLGRLVRLSVPSGIQQLFFSAGFTMLFWIIGQVGTDSLAAASVLINVMLVALLPGVALGLTAATLVGQALGRRDTRDASQWAHDVARMAMLVMGVLGLPMWIVPDVVLSAFIHDPGTLDIARLPMRLVGLSMVIEAVGLTMMHGLLGAGDTRRVMTVSVLGQWALFLPGAYLIGPVLGGGLLSIWILQGVYRLGQALIFLGMWRGHRWARVEV